MAFVIPLEVEATLPGFFITGVPPTASPQAVINEGPPEQGIWDRVIKNNQPWSVTFHYRVGGPVSDAMGPAKWSLNVHLLSLSGGQNKTINQTVAYTQSQGDDNYDVPLSISPGSVKDGLYKLNVSIEVQSTPAGSIIPVTLFGDGPMMKFYTP